VKQQSTVKQNLIVNTIFRHLYPTDRLLINNVLISFDPTYLNESRSRVCISQLIIYARACSFNSDHLQRHLILSIKAQLGVIWVMQTERFYTFHTAHKKKRQQTKQTNKTNKTSYPNWQHQDIYNFLDVH
jgi:hypothetical protein